MAAQCFDLFKWVTYSPEGLDLYVIKSLRVIKSDSCLILKSRRMSSSSYYSLVLLASSSL